MEEKIYDLRQNDDSLRRLFQEIEPRHGVTWRTRKHSLSGFEMTDDRASEFIGRHSTSDVLLAVIFDYGVTVYLSDSSDSVAGRST